MMNNLPPNLIHLLTSLRSLTPVKTHLLAPLKVQIMETQANLTKNLLHQVITQSLNLHLNISRNQRKIRLRNLTTAHLTMLKCKMIL